jgi:hypothetical protein
MLAPSLESHGKENCQASYNKKSVPGGGFEDGHNDRRVLEYPRGLMRNTTRILNALNNVDCTTRSLLTPSFAEEEVPGFRHLGILSYCLLAADEQMKHRKLLRSREHPTNESK